MRKFSEIAKVNEEFFTKKKEQFTKVSNRLMDTYCKNLLNEEFLPIHPDEENKFDYVYYKIQSISRTEDYKFTVVIETYDTNKNMIGEVSHLLEI